MLERGDKTDVACLQRTRFAARGRGQFAAQNKTDLVLVVNTRSLEWQARASFELQNARDGISSWDWELNSSLYAGGSVQFHNF
jgi:hypothetical protein